MGFSASTTNIKTSTWENIDSLFENLVKKYLNPEFIIKINSLNGENIENFDLENVNVDKKKKGCCCCTIF